MDHCAAPWSLAISDIHSVPSAIALASCWTLLSQTLRGRPGLLQLAISFLPSLVSTSGAEHHVLVGYSWVQTDICDNDVRCPRWLTNHTFGEHLCIRDVSLLVYSQYLSLTPHVESLHAVC